MKKNSIQTIYVSNNKQIWTGQMGKYARVESMAVDSCGHVCFLGDISDCVQKYGNTFEQEKKQIQGCIVAGGVDSHNHFWYGLLVNLPSLANCTTPKQAEEFIRNNQSSSGDILFVCNAMNYHNITLNMLDTFSQPVIVLHRSFHMAYLNSAAQKLPQSKLIPQCDWLENWRVRNCMYHLLRADMFDPNYILHSFKSFEKNLIAQGIVCVHDLLVHDIEYLPFMKDLQIEHYLYGREKVIKIAANQGHLDKFVGVKSFIDGAIGSKTAKFLDPYKNENTTGSFYTSSESFMQDVDLALEHNLQTACHGIGSEGIRRIVTVLEKRKFEIENPRIEHFECPYEKDIDRLQNLGGMASLQPNFGQDYNDYKYLLDDRISLINPFRSLIQKQFIFGTGSDGMPSGFRECLLWGILPHNQTQKMSLEEAIHYSTMGAAQLVGKKAGLLLKQTANFVHFTKSLESLYDYPNDNISSDWDKLRTELDLLLPIKNTYINGIPYFSR